MNIDAPMPDDYQERLKLEGEWTAVYWTYRTKYEEKFESFMEAYGCIYWGQEFQSLAGESILDPKGKVFMTDEDFYTCRSDSEEDIRRYLQKRGSNL